MPDKREHDLLQIRQSALSPLPGHLVGELDGMIATVAGQGQRGLLPAVFRHTQRAGSEADHGLIDPIQHGIYWGVVTNPVMGKARANGGQEKYRFGAD